MTRTILATEVEHVETLQRKIIYGRYDPVTLDRQGFRVIKAEKHKYTMKDSDFVKYATKKED